MTGLILPHRTLKHRIARWGIIASALFAVTTSALAHHHPSEYEEADEFTESHIVSGLLHPFTGLDHLLMAVALGWLAFAAGKRRGGMLTVSFFGSFGLGMMAGRLGLEVPMMEQGIALSVVVAGLLLAYATRQVRHSAPILAVLAGLWHGNAHGAEMPAAASIGFGVTLLAGTALAVSTSAGLAALFSSREEPMGRWIGVGITVAGAWLWLA